MKALFSLLSLFVLLMPQSAAHAYVGPGAGAGTIAVVLGVIGAVFFAVVAILWYPMKRLIKGRANNRKSAEPE